jgi:hypothetical protein
VQRPAWVADAVEGPGVGPCEPDAQVEPADGEQSGVTGELDPRQRDDVRHGEEVKDL